MYSASAPLQITYSNIIRHQKGKEFVGSCTIKNCARNFPQVARIKCRAKRINVNRRHSPPHQSPANSCGVHSSRMARLRRLRRRHMVRGRCSVRIVATRAEAVTRFVTAFRKKVLAPSDCFSQTLPCFPQSRLVEILLL